MFKENMNRECVVVVAFSTSVMDGGVASSNYFGTLVGETEEFIIVNVSNVKCDSVLGSNKTLSGNTYISKKYIVAINFR